MMDGQRASLIDQFAAGPAELAAALAAVAPGRVAPRPAPRKWSPREIALHLCHTELSVAFRLRRAAAEPGAAVPAFDQDLWVDTLGGIDDLDLALSTFAALRRETAALLRRLPADAWERTAVHPEAGPVRLADWLDRFVRHTAHHVAQIRALAEAAPPV